MNFNDFMRIEELINQVLPYVIYSRIWQMTYLKIDQYHLIIDLPWEGIFENLGKFMFHVCNGVTM